MRLRRVIRARGDDTGTAIIEFCFLGVLLMVPLVYVVLTVFRLQAASYAVSSAAREAGRVYVTSDATGAPGRAVQAAEIALRDHGLTMASGDVRMSCSDPGHCREAETTVHVRVQHRVPLPLVPEIFGRIVPTSISVSADHVEYVDRFRAGG
jgi:Flp pilus assembly protein TadG